MSLWPIMLRVLLSVALIFNGATRAMSSTHIGHASTQLIAPQAYSTTTVDSPPCHEREPTTSATMADSIAGEAATSPAQSRHAMPDCCESGACRCPCMHQAQAAVPTMAFSPPAIERAVGVRPMSSGHAAPALPHLIRPPIG